MGRVEGSGGEGAEVGLGDEGLNETRVAVALVDGAVGVAWDIGEFQDDEEFQDETEMNHIQISSNHQNNPLPRKLDKHSRISRKHIDIFYTFRVPYSVLCGGLGDGRRRRRRRRRRRQ